MTERDRMLAEVERRLGRRRLVWAGIRGDDVEPLADLEQLHGSFSLAGSFTNRGGVESMAYEELTGVREDPEIWDIDDRLREPATVTFRRALLRALGGSSALLPYRPSQFLSSVHFARQRECVNLGLFGAHQSAFEHKPWVESAVAAMGLPRIEWIYVADEEQLRARELSRKGSVVLRRSRTSGGQGFIHVAAGEDLATAWPAVDEAFVSVSRFLDRGVPVNVGATVWRDGVTVHHPSIQLIGIESCVTREFGYCGNDFGAVRDLNPDMIDQIQISTERVGEWLRIHGYLGSFGVDFLVHGGEPKFMEVNPRFQGSTVASCRIAIEAGRACLMLEHVAAWLGVERPQVPPLRELVATAPDLANLVVHWTGPDTRLLDAHDLVTRVRGVAGSARGDVLTPEHVANSPGSAVARFALRRRVTSTGFELARDIDDVVAAWQRDMRAADPLPERA